MYSVVCDVFSTHSVMGCSLCSQVTTHGHILSLDEVDEISECLQQTCGVEVHSLLLQEFDTELDFTSKIR